MGLNNVYAPQFNLAIRNAIRKFRSTKLTSPIDLFKERELIKEEVVVKAAAPNMSK